MESNNTSPNENVSNPGTQGTNPPEQSQPTQQNQSAPIDQGQPTGQNQSTPMNQGQPTQQNQSAPVNQGQPTGQNQGGQPQAYQPQTTHQVLPSELNKWNWGAFVYNIMWGIGHKVYLPLLCLIPFFGIVWVFICGAKGNQWLWESGQFSTTTELLNSQKSWNRAGFVGFFIFIGLIVLEFLVFIPILSALGAAGTSYYAY